MQGSRLVPLVAAADSFEAHVLTARLQAEGIPCQLRGAADGPYPGVGSQIEILVPESELALASEVLLADEVDATFLDLDVRAGLEGWEDSDTFPSPRRRRPTWLVTVAILIVFLFAMTVLGSVRL